MYGQLIGFEPGAWETASRWAPFPGPAQQSGKWPLHNLVPQEGPKESLFVLWVGAVPAVATYLKVIFDYSSGINFNFSSSVILRSAEKQK